MDMGGFLWHRLLGAVGQRSSAAALHRTTRRHGYSNPTKQQKPMNTRACETSHFRGSVTRLEIFGSLARLEIARFKCGCRGAGDPGKSWVRLRVGLAPDEVRGCLREGADEALQLALELTRDTLEHQRRPPRFPPRTPPRAQPLHPTRPDRHHPAVIRPPPALPAALSPLRLRRCLARSLLCIPERRPLGKRLRPTFDQSIPIRASLPPAARKAPGSALGEGGGGGVGGGGREGGEECAEEG